MANRRTRTNRRTMVRARYAAEDFDSALAYLTELEVFYGFPNEVFTACGSEIHMVEPGKRQRPPSSAAFREAWSLIETFAAPSSR